MSILYGPESEVFNTYTALNNPGDLGSGGPVAKMWPQFLGTQLVLQDGRKFRFGTAGTVTLVVGSMYTAGISVASQQNLTTVITAIGSRTLSMTTGASSAANTFAEGFAGISVTPGGGQMYKIASHALFTTAAGDIVNLAQGHAVRVALTASSKIDLLQNNYKNVVITPATTLAAPVMGLALSAATSTQGLWLQTRGVGYVLNGTGTNIAGTRGVVGVSAGGVSPETATAAVSVLQVTIGTVMHVGTTFSAVYLTIDG